MMQNPPRILNVFGKGYPVVREDLSDQGNLGLFDFEKIIIDKSLDDKLNGGVEEIHTELHELIHAVAERTGLTRTSIHADLWEIICENISRTIVENYKVTPL